MNRSTGERPVTWFNIGISLRELGRIPEEVAAYGKALALAPQFFEAWFNRGIALRALKRHHEALASFDAALAIRSDSADAFNNRGNVLGDLHRYDAALASFDHAISLNPLCGTAHSNRGNALEALGRHAEALRAYADAQRIMPHDADAHWNESLCRLLIGDYAKGWEKYEWRWRTGTYAQGLQPSVEGRLWLGHESLAGKTILLHAEGGFGDTLQFCRFAAPVATHGARVVIEVQPELRRLMSTLDGPHEVITQGQPRPPHDFHCPLMSLPLALKTSLDSIPTQLPYLSANPALAERWRARLDCSDARRLRIGLAWAGNPRLGNATSHEMDKRRSMPFEHYAPLLQIPGIDFYSLQKGEAAVAQLADSPLRTRLVDPSREFADFADTAAFVAHLDLVISVDTSIVHLAASTGKPVWLLNRYDTCWRWLRQRADSPWYPHVVRIFRQRRAGDWDAVIAEVCRALREHLSNGARSLNNSPASMAT